MRSVILLSFGFVLAGLSGAHGQAKLVWKWKEKETFDVVSLRQVKQKLTIEDPGGDPKKGREVNQNYDLNSRLRFNVTGKDAAGNFTVEQVVLRMEVKNTKGAIAPVPGVQDATLTFQINAQGEVTEVKGHDVIIKKLADQGAERELLKSVFSEQALKEGLQEMFAFLPPPNHKTGEKWTRKSDYQLGSLGKLEVTRTFALIGEEKKDERTLTRLTVTSQSAQNFSKDKREVRATGNFYFDTDRGRLATADLTRTTRSATKVQLDREYACELEQTDTVTIQVQDGQTE